MPKLTRKPHRNQNAVEEFLSDPSIFDTYMRRALEHARASLPQDIPIGAVVVHAPTQTIIGESGNTRELNADPTHHAEIEATHQASRHLGDWRLSECVVFSTLEPCIMCAATLLQSRIGAVIFGAYDPQYGAAGSIYNFFVDPRLSHNAPVIGDVLGNECKDLLDTFFQSLRT